MRGRRVLNSNSSIGADCPDHAIHGHMSPMVHEPERVHITRSGVIPTPPWLAYGRTTVVK
jgi:hypothetical protein